jgi:hypothetical protein
MPAFNRSTSILIAATRIALEPSKRISRVKVAGVAIKTFPSCIAVDTKWPSLFTLAKFF